MINLSSNEIQEYLFALSKAKYPLEVIEAWRLLRGNYKTLCTIVSLETYNKKVVPPIINRLNKSPFNHLGTYFINNSLYFLDDELITKMTTTGKVDIHFDYTLMFDTNVDAYINKLIRGESLKNIRSDLISLVDMILYDGIHFNFFFYMIENIKIVRHLTGKGFSKLQFWSSMNKNFRKNLVSLYLFRSIDCEEYKKSRVAKPIISYRKATRNAVDNTFKFYSSENSHAAIDKFVFLQRIMLLHLIGMVRIQLSSNKSFKHKIDEFLTFMHEIIGAYYGREEVIALKYFEDRKCLTALNKIQKGGKNERLQKTELGN